MKIDELHRAAIDWSRLTEGNDERATKLITKYGYVESLAMLRQNDHRLAEYGKARLRWQTRLAALATFDYRVLDKLQISVLTPEDSLWPKSFVDLGLAAPLALWVCGDPQVLVQPAVSLVGSRDSSMSGRKIALDFAHELARDYVLVSGGAFGIDKQAHRGALVAGGKTVLVSAGGVNRAYPKAHADLYKEVAQNGVIISESPLGASPQRFRFLMRNRLIAALGLATVVIEAGARSGALVTARKAMEIGREVGAVPAAIGNVRSAGCNELIRNGAVLLTNPQQVREMIMPIGADLSGEINVKGQRSVEYDELAERIYDAVPKVQAQDTLGVARLAGCEIMETRLKLSKLAISGRVVCVNGRWKKG